jgi:hypothetical protein
VNLLIGIWPTTDAAVDRLLFLNEYDDLKGENL